MANEGSPANPSLSGAQILAKLLALGALGAAFTDSAFAITGSSDATKIARFEVDGLTTATTRVYTLPDASITVAGINLAQTFSATQTFAAIDATSIGATTRGTGLFTTLGANGAATLTSTLAVTGLSTLTGGLTTPAQITSTIATGTAPLVVASTTVVANLNASLLLGSTWSAPGSIGSGTPAAGAFTTLAASSTLVVTSTGSFGGSVTVTGSARKVFVDHQGGEGELFSGYYNSSNSRGGLYVGSAGEPYFGGNIVNTGSGGDVYSRGTIPPWRIGNGGGSSTLPLQIDVAVAGTAGSAITWLTAITIDTAKAVTLAGTLASGAITSTGLVTGSSIKGTGYTAGRVIFTGTGGLFSDSANWTWDEPNARVTTGTMLSGTWTGVGATSMVIQNSALAVAAANYALVHTNLGDTYLNAASGRTVRLMNANNEAGQFDGDSTAGNTRFLLYDVTAGALVRVSRGASDSGGTGFRLLRIPN